MLISSVFARSVVGSWSLETRALVAALLVAVAASLLGRTRRARFLVPVAPGLGLLAGWMAVVGFPIRPAGLVSHLPMIALVATLCQPVAEARTLGRPAWPVAALLALICAWWLVEAPHLTIPTWHEGLTMLALVAWITAIAWLATDADPFRVAAASIALSASLHAVGAAAIWSVLALGAAPASLGAAIVRPGSWSKAPPPLALSTAMAAMAAAGSLAIGRLPHGRIGPIDVACLALPATLGLAAWITRRFRRPTALGLALAALLACGTVVLIAFSAAALNRLR
jgi:hypothetical protein